MNRKLLSLIAAICGAAGFISVFLTWASREIASGKSESYDAFELAEGGRLFETGTFVLIFCLLAGAATLLVHLRMTKVTRIDARQLLFLCVALFGLAALMTVIRFFHEAFEPDQISRGFGIYLAVLATVGGAVASFLAARKPPVKG